jgi:hypothetical protein
MSDYQDTDTSEEGTMGQTGLTSAYDMADTVRIVRHARTRGDHCDYCTSDRDVFAVVRDTDGERWICEDCAEGRMDEDSLYAVREAWDEVTS